jgi:hypothetical protein
MSVDVLVDAWRYTPWVPPSALAEMSVSRVMALIFHTKDALRKGRIVATCAPEGVARSGGRGQAVKRRLRASPVANGSLSTVLLAFERAIGCKE